MFCSISLTALSKSLVSVLVVFSSSSNSSWLCSRHLLDSVIYVDNLPNRLFIDSIFEFISSLMAASQTASSSLTVVLIVSRRIWSFSCGRVAVGVSRVGLDLSIVAFGLGLLLDDAFFVFTMVTQFDNVTFIMPQNIDILILLLNSVNSVINVNTIFCQ